MTEDEFTAKHFFDRRYPDGGRAELLSLIQGVRYAEAITCAGICERFAEDNREAFPEQALAAESCARQIRGRCTTNPRTE